MLDGKQLGTVDLVCGEDVGELTFGIAFEKLLRMYLFVPSNHTEQVEALAAETVRT
jgi:hypothetical protein